MNSSRVIWITGLSGAGKTTLGKELTKLMENNLKKVIFLDGDELRKIFISNKNENKSFSLNERKSLSYSYAKLSKFLVEKNINVVIATISLFKEVHQWNRKNIFSYYEIYLRTPLKELKKRDVKGIYKKFEEGKIKNVVGLDLDYDEPILPDLILDNWKIEDIKKTAERVYFLVHQK